MRKRSILIVAMLAVSGLSQAQTSKSDFDKAVNFVNCKAIKLSLKKSPTIGVTSQFNGKCDCQAYPDFNSIKSAIATTETKTIDLSIEIDKLKTNEYKPSLTTDDVIKLLTEDIFTSQTKYSKLYEFANKRKDDPAFTSLKEELKQDLNAFFSNESPPIIITLEDRVTGLEGKVTALENKPLKSNKGGWFSSHINYFVIFALLLSVVAVLLIIVKIARLKPEKEQSMSSSEVYDNVISTILNGRRFGDFIQGELNRKVIAKDIIKSVISELKPEITKLIEQQHHNKPTLEWNITSQENFSNQEVKQPEIKTATETFYLSTPNSDGSFNESSASSSYREGASIYRFTKVPNSSRAKFQIDDREASIKLALQYPDKNIDPVCDAINAFNPKAKKIVTDSPGEAELTGDKWIKNFKAKIKYES